MYNVKAGLLMGKHQPPPPNIGKYEKSRIYKITCPTCNMKYTGQTGRSFNTRFRERLRDFKYGYGISRFAQHLPENGHSIGPMEEIITPCISPIKDD